MRAVPNPNGLTFTPLRPNLRNSITCKAPSSIYLYLHPSAQSARRPDGLELGCPAAQAPADSFSRISAGKALSAFPLASRVSCEGSCPPFPPRGSPSVTSGSGVSERWATAALTRTLRVAIAASRARPPGRLNDPRVQCRAGRASCGQACPGNTCQASGGIPTRGATRARTG